MTNPRNDLNSVTAMTGVGAAASVNAGAAAGSFLSEMTGMFMKDPKMAFWIMTPVNLLFLHIPLLNLIYLPFLMLAICILLWMARGLVMGSAFVLISLIALYPFLRYGLFHFSFKGNEADEALFISVVYMSAYHFGLRFILLNDAAYNKAIERIRGQAGLPFATEIGVRGSGGKAIVVLYDEPTRTLAFVAKGLERVVPLSSVSYVSWVDSPHGHDLLEFHGIGSDNLTLRTRLRDGAEALANRLEGQRTAA